MKDIEYCSSSYLMYRYVFDETKSFFDTKKPSIVSLEFERSKVKNADDLLDAISTSMQRATCDGKAVLALSGGMDSAILAKFMPKNSKAYTFRCVVPGKKVIDESLVAAKWAKICGLEHEIIDITWDMVKAVTDELMNHKNAPIHSIEAQIYIAAKIAKQAGFDKMIFGENADIIYGGMDGLLKKDWLFGEFVDRYTYVMPYKVLKNSQLILTPYKEFEKNGHIDGHDFINKYFRQEALGTYTNACESAGITFVGPYSETEMATPIDYGRIRSGESKYIVREAFEKLYPGVKIPDKIPMPRPVDEWFANWDGPQREEFIPHCADVLDGNQKWMVWVLERFLNKLEI